MKSVIRHLSVCSILAIVACSSQEQKEIVSDRQGEITQTSAEATLIERGDVILSRLSLDQQVKNGFKPRKNLAAYH